MSESNSTKQQESFEIRIRSDGQIQLHGISEELLEIAAELCPNDSWLMKRLDVIKQKNRQQNDMEEREYNYGTVESD